jgi:hypothetical protein
MVLRQKQSLSQYVLSAQPNQWKTDMKLGMLGDYKAGSSKSAERKLAKYKLDLVGVQ